MKEYYVNVGLSTLCGLFGKTRQAWYEQMNRHKKRRFDERIILDLVTRERQVASRVGCRSLFGILRDDIKAHGIKMGRDAFFDLLRRHDLLIRPKRKYTVTTNSFHRFRKYPNLMAGREVVQSERIWVSDITYIRVGQRFCYLILITDAYSRKIVGWNFGETMEAAFCVKALEEALANRIYPLRPLLHHSDRGVQYCSNLYVGVLKENGIEISMTESGSPYENALAERMNRTLKDRFDIERTFGSFAEAQRTIDLAIAYYNDRLVHSSCSKMTPAQAHLHQGELVKSWKTPAERKQKREKAATSC